jgi:hypothetical protein
MLRHSSITTRNYGGRSFVGRHLKYLLCMKQYCYPLPHNVTVFRTNTSSLQRTNWKQNMGVKHLKHTLYLKRSASDFRFIGSKVQMVIQKMK